MSIFGFFSKGNDKAGQDKPAQSAEKQQNPCELPFVKKILIVADGSQASLDAVDFAISFAAHVPSCELCAAFVIDTASMDLLLQMHIFVSEERSSFESELEKKGRHTLDFVRGQGLKFGLDIETFLVKGRMNQVILQAVRELGVDMIVIGGWHNGSTRKDASSVERQLLLDQADCPVIVVKHKDNGKWTDAINDKKKTAQKSPNSDLMWQMGQMGR